MTARALRGTIRSFTTTTVYALDIDRVPVEGKFTGADVRRAIQGHVLAEASLTGTYTLNPRLVK